MERDERPRELSPGPRRASGQRPRPPYMVATHGTDTAALEEVFETRGWMGPSEGNNRLPRVE